RAPALRLVSSSAAAQVVGSDVPPASGAGDGNRTHVASLEGSSSAIELHPLRFTCLRLPTRRRRSSFVAAVPDSSAPSPASLRSNRAVPSRGGESRIRTCEGGANGFTVRPSWPLWYLPVRLLESFAPPTIARRLHGLHRQVVAHRLRSRAELAAGVEPATTRLQSGCSAS